MSTKEQIDHVAAELLAEQGCEAVSTKAVAVAVGIHALTIYRHFNDMKALLDAVASFGFASYSRTP